MSDRMSNSAGDTTGMGYTDRRVSVLKPRQKLDPEMVQTMINELRDSVINAAALGLFDRLQWCYRTRRCLWNGQQALHDGRQGKQAEGELKDKDLYRWAGAPDLKVPLADEIVREGMLVRSAVWDMGKVRIGPRDVEAGSSDAEQAALWQGVLDYYLDLGKWGVSKALELWGTCVDEFGYGILAEDWRAERRLEKKEISVEQVVGELVRIGMGEVEEQTSNAELQTSNGISPEESAGGEDGEVSPEVVEALAQEAAVQVEMLRMGDEATAVRLVGVVLGMDPAMSLSEAKKVVAGLKKEDAVPYYVVREDGGRPVVWAPIPWVNVLHGVELGGDGTGTWFSTPEWMSEVTLRERAMLEEWDEKFLEAVLAQPNQGLVELVGMVSGGGPALPGWTLNGAGIGLMVDTTRPGVRLFQIFYVWRVAVDDRGLPMVYKTVLHPFVPELAGLHVPTDLEVPPFRVECRETCNYAVESRGVPEIVADKQSFLKDALDGEGARSQLGSKPPLERTVDQHVAVRPGMQLFAKRSGVGGQNKFMDVPRVDEGTLKMMEKVEDIVNAYFFRGGKVDPKMRELFMRWLANRWKLCIGEMVRLMWELVQENIGEVKASRIMGRPVNLTATRDQVQGEMDITIEFADEMFSEDGGEKFLEFLGKLASVDRGGLVDWAAATEMAAGMLDPVRARRLIRPADVAAKSIVNDEQDRITRIMAGVALEYPEQINNPQLRLETLQQWGSDPNNLARLQTMPAVGEMMQKEAQYLQFQVQQYEVNPLVGRSGVKPGKEI